MENRNIPVILNLCDDFSAGYAGEKQLNEMIENLYRYAPFPVEITGIRIGAETCGFLFSRMTVAQWKAVSRMAGEILKRDGLSVTLTVPVVEQSAWKAAKKLLEDALQQPWIHSMAVNDFGALKVAAGQTEESLCRGKKIVLGRYFDKRFRDPRVPDEDMTAEESAVCSDTWNLLIRQYGICGVELECMKQNPGFYDTDLDVSVHFPYSLVSSGQICEFSGIGNPEKGRFEIGHCREQCRGIIGTAFHKSLKKPLIKSENALYMKNSAEMLDPVLLKSPGFSLIYTEL